MKAKTIKQTIDKKINFWLDSIEDESVRKACRKDLIVTGGSIASMLLKEDVNDYDIYFKNIETAKKVSEYYVKKVNEIYSNSISNSIVEVIDSREVSEANFKSRHGEDDRSKWNIFVKSLLQGEDRVKIYIPHVGYWRRDLTSHKVEKPCEPLFLSENAITLSDDIQLVIRFFGEAQKIHENYDFVHATNYFHYENGKAELILRAEALEAILTKELIYIGSKYPLTSVIRTKKFIKKGFSITAGTYLKILWQVAELDLKDISVLQEQLIGVDIAYFSLLIEVLSNVDPAKLDYNYMSNLIDRVFNDSDESE